MPKWLQHLIQSDVTESNSRKTTEKGIDYLLFHKKVIIRRKKLAQRAPQKYEHLDIY